MSRSEEIMNTPIQYIRSTRRDGVWLCDLYPDEPMRFCLERDGQCFLQGYNNESLYAWFDVGDVRQSPSHRVIKRGGVGSLEPLTYNVEVTQ